VIARRRIETNRQHKTEYFPTAAGLDCLRFDQRRSQVVNFPNFCFTPP
jgi:hypothetical protein